MLQNWDFLLLEIWGLLAITALLTLLVTWFVWGRASIRANIHKLEQTEAELDSMKTTLTQTRAELRRAKDKQEALKDRLAREQVKLMAAMEKPEPVSVQSASDYLKGLVDKGRSSKPTETHLFKRMSTATAKLRDKVTGRS
jgi:predicted  nucleic acid-binding Zn-ribbon protein